MQDRTNRLGTPQHWHRLLGFASFNTAFSILTTPLFSILYVQILTEIDAQYTRNFTIPMVVITSVVSLFLPIIGVLVDQRQHGRRAMFGTLLAAFAMCLFFIPLTFIRTQSLRLVMLQFDYQITLIFLKVAMMNNNALLTCYPVRERVRLSLYFGNVYFGAATVGIIVLWGFRRVPELTPISQVYIFTVLATVIGIFSYMCPTDARCYQDRVPWLSLLRAAPRISWQHFVSIANNPRQHDTLWFLAYALVCSAAAVFCTCFTTLMSRRYGDAPAHALEVAVMLLNLSMFVGTVFGLVVTFRGWELHAMFFQNAASAVLFVLFFVSLQRRWAFETSASIALGVGALYGWHSCLCRGYLATLVYQERRVETFGFFQLVSDVGIAVQVVLVFGLALAGGAEYRAAPLALLALLVPSLLILLHMMLRHRHRHCSCRCLRNCGNCESGS
eukprot:TRINITY_DN2155_c0_g1_i6.p1 TRINITY_DN2155_c0_g1~~TRINITY_DN2155_c0_g1_i6.p1  ORF type:complete len:444 (+),score=101.53 TRINITY_DN2155_c0_g1_i6:463-1794(+)